MVHAPPRLTVPSINVGSYALESVVQSSYWSEPAPLEAGTASSSSFSSGGTPCVYRSSSGGGRNSYLSLLFRRFPSLSNSRLLSFCFGTSSASLWMLGRRQTAHDPAVDAGFGVPSGGGSTSRGVREGGDWGGERSEGGRAIVSSYMAPSPPPSFWQNRRGRCPSHLNSPLAVSVILESILAPPALLSPPTPSFSGVMWSLAEQKVTTQISPWPEMWPSPTAPSSS